VTSAPSLMSGEQTSTHTHLPSATLAVSATSTVTSPPTLMTAEQTSPNTHLPLVTVAPTPSRTVQQTSEVTSTSTMGQKLILFPTVPTATSVPKLATESETATMVPTKNPIEISRIEGVCLLSLLDPSGIRFTIILQNK